MHKIIPRNRADWSCDVHASGVYYAPFDDTTLFHREQGEEKWESKFLICSDGILSGYSAGKFIWSSFQVDNNNFRLIGSHFSSQRRCKIAKFENAPLESTQMRNTDTLNIFNNSTKCICRDLPFDVFVYAPLITFRNMFVKQPKSCRAISANENNSHLNFTKKQQWKKVALFWVSVNKFRSLNEFARILSRCRRHLSLIDMLVDIWMFNCSMYSKKNENAVNFSFFVVCSYIPSRFHILTH